MSINEVARRAGISIATVSRVFNSPTVVHAETRHKVLQAARELGYVANASARTLRTRHSKVLGVALPLLTNPVFAECLQGIALEAQRFGYAILPCTTEYQTHQEEAAVERLLSSDVDGVVLVVSNPRQSRALARLQQAGKPYVLAYSRTAEHACVSVDNVQAVETLIGRLAQAGHRSITMVTGQLQASDRAQQRCRGYVQGMAAVGLPAQEIWEVPFAATAVSLLQQRLSAACRAGAAPDAPAPTALVCSNDLLAIRALRAAALAGLAVPQDLCVAGFDGIALGQDLTPSLASITQPNELIGSRSVALLCQALQEGRKSVGAQDSIFLPHGWRSGESCPGLKGPLSQALPMD